MTLQGHRISASLRSPPPAVVGILLALILTAPGAVAGGTLEAGPVILIVEDVHGTTCAQPVAGFCFFNLTEGDGSLGSREIDADQRIHYIGIATDAEAGGQRVTTETPVPLDAILLRGDELYLRYAKPIRINDTFHGERITTPLGEDYWIRLTDDNVTIGWWGPTTKNATAPFENQTFAVRHNTEFANMSSEASYLRTPDLNDGIASRSTDPALDEGPTLSCKYVLKLIIGDAACQEFRNATMAPIYGATPNVRFGYAFEDVQVAPTPEQLTPPRKTVQGVVQATASEEFTYAPAALLPDEMLVVASATPAEESFSVRHTPRTPETRLVNGVTGEAVPASTLAPASSVVPRTASHPALPATVAVVGLAIGAFFSALYSRFTTKRDALASATRATLSTLVRERPGIPWMDAARAVNLTRNALGHHVRVLERAGVLCVVESEGKRFLYHTADRPLSVPVPPSILQHPVRGTLLKWLVGTPEGLTREDLARGLPHVPERSRRYHIERLITLGLAREEEATGGERRLFARPISPPPTPRQP